MPDPSRTLKFAIPKGSLQDPTIELLAKAGYARREFWSDDGWDWLAASGLKAPRYWVKEGTSWRLRRFDRTIALPRAYPVIHVNWHEANAYCRFARRRLPTRRGP